MASELKPRISAYISSSSQLIPETVMMKLDDKVVPNNYEMVDITHAVVYYTPVKELTNESYHNVNLVVYDATGVPAISTWRFYLNTYPEMSVPSGSCETCHFTGNIAQHPTNQCSLCHQPQSHGGRTAPFGDCLWCHNFLYNAGFTWMRNYPAGFTHDGTKLPYENRERYFDFTDCTQCHISTQYNLIPRHALAFDEALKHQTTLDKNCVTCHSVTLTREHARPDRTDKNNNPITCNTCHNSTIPQVKQAVDHHNKDCSACHDSTHGLTVLPNLPNDISVYPGLKWSSPIPLSLWKGEPWISFNPAGYTIILSNRSRLSGVNVWNFYRDSMDSLGWTRESAAPDPGNSSFSVTFTKNGRKAIIWFYGSEDHSETGTVPTGSRIEMIFTP